MADEILHSILLDYSKGGREADTRDMAVTGLYADVSGTDVFRGTQTLTTSEAALSKGNITTPGLTVIKNLDATNNALIRPATGGTNAITIKPGEAVLFRPAGSAPFALSSASTVEIDILMVED